MKTDPADRSSGSTASIDAARYPVELRQNADGSFFASVPDLPGCMTEGDTAVAALEGLEDAMCAWISTAVEDGVSIPAPRGDEDFSGRFVVRVPRSMHRELVGVARREGVSLNTLVVSALGVYLGAR